MSWVGNRVNRRMFNLSNKAGKRFQSIGATISKAPTGVKLMGGAASLGLGALCAGGYMMPATYASPKHRNMLRQYGGDSYAQMIRSRVGKTYGYLTCGLGMTAGVAVAAFRKGWAIRIASMNPLVFAGASILGCWVTMAGIHSTPMENYPVKLAFWGGLNTLMGLSLVPLGCLGGPLVTQAAMITACVVGSLSAVAACSPGDEFLSMGPLLGCGLGVVIAASFGQMFFPASPLLHNVALYGGLGLFGLFICYDTQKILYHAQMDNNYDPMSRQVGIYMHTLNIFIRVAQVLAMGGGRRK